MNAGVILVGIALTTITVAYVVRPFCIDQASGELQAGDRSNDDMIESWVARVREEQDDVTSVDGEAVCGVCGHVLGSADRFCSRCGAEVGSSSDVVP